MTIRSFERSEIRLRKRMRSFGGRWASLCEYYGVAYYDYTVGFAKDIDYSDLEEKIVEEKPDVLLCQHHETSTGQLFNLEIISDI